MNKVVHLIAVRQERALSEQEAWDRYVVARDQAETSGDIKDGIAAGKAWRAWLERFGRVA